jgi:CTP:molybdopterin cytidylyltransferase MocA
VTLGGIVLAAGEATRFGAPKQLAALDGRPLVEHAVAALESVCDRVVVVLGAHAGEVRRGARLPDAVVCEDWEQGPFTSMRCGLAALGDDHDAVVIALGDQPGLTAERIRAVLAFDAPLARARDGDAPSHPIVVRPGAEFTHPAVRAAPGPDLGSLPDVDTRDDLEALTR